MLRERNARYIWMYLGAVTIAAAVGVIIAYINS